MPWFLRSLGFSPDAVLRSRVRRHADLTLWMKHLYRDGLASFYERVPSHYVIQLEDTEKYRSSFIDTYTRLVQSKRNEDAHFLRVLREEALEYIEAVRSPEVREALYRVPNPEMDD